MSLSCINLNTICSFLSAFSHNLVWYVVKPSQTFLAFLMLSDSPKLNCKWFETVFRHPLISLWLFWNDLFKLFLNTFSFLVKWKGSPVIPTWKLRTHMRHFWNPFESVVHSLSSTVSVLRNTCCRESKKCHTLPKSNCFVVFLLLSGFNNIWLYSSQLSILRY